MSTAVLWIPPESIREPIQAIRRKHDAQVDRWMPHVTLMYPFVTRNQFPDAKKKLRDVCSSIADFQIRLARFEYFHESRTLYLTPEPADAFRKLRAAFPFCGEDFIPHMTVGQGTPELQRELQSTWKPLECPATEIALIRGFTVEKTFRFSAPGY